MANMGAQADTVARRLPQWGAVAERCGDETDLDAGAYIAAVSPDLLLRLVAHAKDALGRHRVEGVHGDYCSACEQPFGGCPFPCPEVAAVIKAWLP